MSEPWSVISYNDLDAGFGYDPGPQAFYRSLPKAMAKSIARHLNKTTPGFMRYWAEPERWV